MAQQKNLVKQMRACSLKDARGTVRCMRWVVCDLSSQLWWMDLELAVLKFKTRGAPCSQASKRRALIQELLPNKTLQINNNDKYY